MSRSSRHHRCQHRHCAGSAGRRRSRSDPEERRSGDVCRQGRRPADLAFLRAGDGRAGKGPAPAGNGSAPGDNGRRFRSCTTSPASAFRTTGSSAAKPWCDGASRARHDLALGIHSHCGRDRPDQPARRMGVDDRMRGGSDLARRYQAGGQRFAGSVQERHAGLEDRRGAGGVRSAGEPAGTGDHRSGAYSRRRRSTCRFCISFAPSACGSRSTISVPAIRR